MSEIGFYEKPEVFKEYESLRILMPVYPLPEDEKEGKGAMYINSEHYLLAVLNYCYGIIRNNLSLSAVLPTDPDEDALLVGSNIELYKRLLLVYRNALIYNHALPRKLPDILFEKNYRASGELGVLTSRQIDPNREHVTIACLRTRPESSGRDGIAEDFDEFRAAWASYEQGRPFFKGFEDFYSSYWKKQRVIEKDNWEEARREADGSYGYEGPWSY